MSISSEITRLQNAKASLKSAIEAKGVTVSSSLALDEYASKVAEIPTGVSGYSITTNITNGTYSGATVMYPDSTGLTIEAVVTLTPNTGYELIDVIVTNATYSINWETRTITLTHATDNIVITADVRQASVGLEFEQINGTRSATNYRVKGIGTCIDTDIVIPSTYNGGKVVEIGDKVFIDNANITSIAMPYNVVSIGDYAFSGCSSLTSVIIPDSVTSIGVSAFRWCNNLTYNTYDNALYLGNANNPYHTLIRAKNTSIPSVSISEKTKIIYDGAFISCYNLSNIIIPNNITSINNYVFQYCTNLISVTIPDSVISIGDSAFSNCSSLANVTIPNSVISIGDSAFYGCSSLTSISIPDSVTSIGHTMFAYCENLISITVSSNNTIYHSSGNCIIDSSGVLIAGCNNSTIPTDGSVTSIGVYAFKGCTSLTSITIPNGVISIREFAFAECTSLANITISRSVTSIVGYNVFDSCCLDQGTVIIYYDGYLSDIMNDSTYIQNVIFAIYNNFHDLTATFIDLNEDSQDIPLADFFGGSGSGSGSGSGGDWPPSVVDTFVVDSSNEISYSDYSSYETKYYGITPQEDGTYYIYVESDNDSYGILYDDAGNEIASDDNSHPNGRDFCISEYLYGYNAYYLAVKEVSDGELGSYTLHIDMTGPQS